MSPMSEWDPYLIALGLIVAWCVGAYVLQKRGILARHHIVPYAGPILMWKTERGKAFLDWLARPKRFWRIFGDVSLVLVSLAMLGTTALLAWEATLVQSAAIRANPPSPALYLGLPGINPIIPIGYGIFALAVSIVLHEFAHGILSRSSNVKVNSLGGMFFVVPIGAFVEPNEDEMRAMPRRERMRLYAAGPATNIVLAIVFGVLFSTTMMYAVQPVHTGMAIIGTLPVSQWLHLGNSPSLDLSRVEPNRTGVPDSIVIPRNGSSEFDLMPALQGPFQLLSVDANLYVNSSSPGGATLNFTLSLIDLNQTSGGSQVVAVNATSAHVSGSDYALFTLQMTLVSKAQQHNFPIGHQIALRVINNKTSGAGMVLAFNSKNYDANLAMTASSPAYVAGLRENMLITRVNGTELTTYADFTSAIGNVRAWTVVNVQGYNATSMTVANYTIILGSDSTGQRRLLGIYALPVDPTYYHPLTNPDDFGGVVNALFVYISLPFSGHAPIGSLETSFYRVTGPAAAIPAPLFWLLVNSLYWLFWINFALGTFNALPMAPLDGGVLFSDGVKGFLLRVKSRLTPEARDRLANNVSYFAALAILFLVLWQFIGPRI